MIINNDCLIALKELPENSIDAIVTDPPYGLSFMGKKWDYDVPSVEIWAECLRVLKPGGYLLAFAGTRTQHRMAVRIEDAGFEIRDMIAWIYGQGFPKSTNIFKQLQKNCTCGNMEAYEKETIQGEQSSESHLRPMPETDISETVNSQNKQGEVLQSELSEQSSHETMLREESKESSIRGEEWVLEGGDNTQKTEGKLQGSDLSKMPKGVSANGEEGWLHNATQISHGSILEQTIDQNGSNTSHRPQSEQQQDREPCTFCKQWGTQALGALGYGSALKPSLEPITVARKPISEKSLALNFLKWGVGGINIDGSRVGTEEITTNGKGNQDGNTPIVPQSLDFVGETHTGRFPANLIHDGSDEVLGLFPESKSGNGKANKYKEENPSLYYGGWGYQRNEDYGDNGSAARFFYCAKSSKRERNKGLDGTLTVKYTGTIWKEENIVAAQLLKKVISGMAQMSFSTGESGESLMVQFPKGSSFITETIINKIMTSQILNSLTLSLTNEYTQDANLEVELGGNLVENVANLKAWILTITKDNLGLALGANHVALEMLSQISKKENWKEATNFHSTVKPIALMEYLVKLVSKEGHTVLDPFLGSGTTGIACKNLNRNCIGIERDSEYVKIAEARINAV